jgi:hypothetical protein
MDFLKSMFKVQSHHSSESAPYEAEAVEKQMIHEQNSQEDDLEFYSNPYQQKDKINESWIISDEERILEPEIEEFHGCLSPDPLCTKEYEDQFSE